MTDTLTLVPGSIEKQILEAVQRIKFGAVEVTVHDSRIVQIETSEKVRFDKK